MRTLNALFLAIVFSAASYAQYRGTISPRPVVQGGFGNVVFPGGTSALPGVHRSFGNVVFPGTGGPRLNVPFSITDPTFGDRLSRTVSGQNVLRQQYGAQRRRGGAATYVPYAYPVYVGGYGTPYLDGSYAQQQPNVLVIYPPQPAPVIINQMSPEAAAPPPDTVGLYQAPVQAPPPEGAAMSAEPTRYLIAYKDHTIYSAVAYWVEGETLHYFTNGNTHNQVSLSLVDRELTERLNKQAGAEVRLPK